MRISSGGLTRHKITTEQESREAESKEMDQPEGLRRWFMFQRSYPFDSVPAEARRRAWDSRPSKGRGIEAEATQWNPIGPASTVPLFSNFGVNSGRINTIAVSPANPQLVLIGASTGGIWRSTDGGVTFSPVSDTQVDLAVGSIAFSRSNPSIVYAGMGDMQGCCDYMGSGVLKSTDSGQTWAHINNSTLREPGSASKIEVDPNDPNRVYLALYLSLNNTNANSFFYGGVYVSTDGGVSWAKTLTGLPRDLAISPANPQTIYAAMEEAPNVTTGPGLYKSTNGGMSWSLSYSSPYTGASGTQDIRVAISPAASQRVYVIVGNKFSGGELRVEMSDDGGNSWSSRGATVGLDNGQIGYNTYIYADPTNADILYVGTRDVFKSMDKGVTWANLTRANINGKGTYSQALAHPDQHALAFSPADSNNIYIGTDGGLYKSDNGGGSFQSLNQTLSLTQFTSIARHPTDPNITYGGTQDNGTQRRLPGSNQWQDFVGGDGGRVVVAPLNPSRVYTTVYSGTVLSWSNNGGTFRGETDNTTFGESIDDNIARISFYPPLAGNGINSTLYFGTWKLFINTSPETNFTGGWTAPGGATDLTRGGSDVLSAIGVSRSDTNVIYTGSEQGQVMVSTNGGVNWSPILNGLPNRFITSIAVDPANSAVAFLTVSGFGSGHVYKTTNTGASWTDISGNLPNTPVNALLINPNNPNILYAGTDVGVLRSTVGGTSWQAFNNGMPPAVVMGFTANTSGQIQLATYGRGAYQSVDAAPVCTYALNTSSQSFTNTGGSGSINVTAGSGCAWTTSNNAPWVLVFSIGQDGPGSGQINFSVAANNTNSARSGTITIAGQTFTINQAAGNIIDDAQTFVTQQYQDFLNRQPDTDGLGYWTSQITNCGSNAQCIHDRRVGVADAFFFEDEFQKTGAYIYRVYKSALGQRPTYAQFSADRGSVVSGPGLDQSKTTYAQNFAGRSDFLALYPRSYNADQFVDNLLGSINTHSGVNLASQRSSLISLYDGTDSGRAAILRQIADSQAFVDAEYNQSFVLMEYFGYLRREADQGGYDFWLAQVNKFPLRNVGIQHAMACSFITSAEYQLRFNSVVTHTNRECPQ
ncbi:MAG TPA: DUF4214 domain-containing protein [Pyrinomonadaceae bacterium]|nr:DUF4214 domain-containing protein [Pyrinomonadaceae bacterium]